MLRRDFIQMGTLGVAGLLAAGTSIQAAAVPMRVAIVDPDSGNGDNSRGADAVAGVTAMLREKGVPCELIQRDAEFSSYKVLILPDHVLFDPSFTKKIESYLQRGGAVLASWRSGLTPDGAQFATPAFGILRVGEALYSPDFIDTSSSPIGQNLASSELVMYLRGIEVLPTDATVLARTLAPMAGAASYPALTESGKVIYFMHPIFTQYHRSAPRWCRQLVLNALDRLVPGVTASKTIEASHSLAS